MINNFISFNDIETKLVEVSEQIHPKNFKLFLTTNLDIDTNIKNVQIFYHFLEKTNEYFLCKYTNNKNKTTIFDHVIKHIATENKDIIALVFLDGYFLIYDRLNLYYYQKLDDSFAKDDVIDYVQRRFLIKIDNVITLSYDLLDTYNDVDSNLKYYSEKNNSENYYLASLIVGFIFVAFAYFYFDMENKKHLQKLSKIKSDIQSNEHKISKKFLDHRIAKIINKLNDENIKIKKIDYKDGRLFLELFSIRKDSIYPIFAVQKNLKIDSMTKNSQGYDINVFFIL